MLKGLAITPPVVGRISIGRVIERNGKRLPEKDDQFTLTSQVQGRDGWLLHPLDEKLRKEAEGQKLRAIPVRLLFNDPGLNLRADYSLFDRTTGRPMCMGNGETCRRTGKDGTISLPCPGPDACAFSKEACKAYARLNVVVGDGEASMSLVSYQQPCAAWSFGVHAASQGALVLAGTLLYEPSTLGSTAGAIHG